MNNMPLWLALLHQLPAKPPYLRVKIWRRLQGIGAVPLKNAVHVLPHSAEGAAAFRDLMAEITANGGEATLIEAHLLAGQSDSEVRALFDAARNADYEEVAQAARRLLETGPASGPDIARLHKRMDDIGSLDFFGAHGRQEAEAALAILDSQRYRHPDVSRADPANQSETIDLTNRVWVTRSGVHVDRIACAWLIRRFIDPDARFRFVDSRHHDPADGELRFDMADAEFTHEGDRCSFETLLLRAKLLDDPALVAIGQIIHDLDIGDGKFARPETPGLSAILSGVCASTDDDLQRIAMASDALNQFHAFFSNRKTDR
ncbi:Chromate resistance exported protein [Sphingobium chlorophenolicum L-1]|uniref:Chromate resistance exported protein n=1 Tax=Sphingobium chlorophenolicum L-1 TaxID=690566 RepID=F6EVY5_SPHCR|nr:chromate resistance protein ChrB domain-containing protein [Sphingobium chlorophenolicum]AEG48031.1 Chromate resistance exported protein [Sphingobium chlorophenolicum L-1]